MIKIFTEGNYFFIVENEIEYEAHAKDVKVHRFSTSSEIFIFKNVNQWDGTRKVNLSDIFDKDDAPYTLESFLTFKNEETGKSSTGGGGETTDGDTDVKNLQATLVFNLEDDLQVQNGDSFDLTPNVQLGNTFDSLLTLDTVNRVITTFNTERLNLGIDVFLQLSSGALSAYDVALQRANETTLIERTKRQLFRRPDQGAATGGPTGVTLSSFTSGVTDPFNVVGFKVSFLNTSGQTITLIAGEIRIDVFAVYDVAQ